MKMLCLLLLSFVVSGCVTQTMNFKEPNKPQSWLAETDATLKTARKDQLKEWWRAFHSPTLNQLIALGLSNNASLKIAQERIAEAQGYKTSKTASFLPQLSLTADGGRDKMIQPSRKNFYQTGASGSLDIDLFGTRKQLLSYDAHIDATQALCLQTQLKLISEITQGYIDYCALESEWQMAQKIQSIQEDILKHVQDQKAYGLSRQMDIEKSESTVHILQSQTDNLQRLKDNARLKLTVLIGLLPQEIKPLLDQPHPPLPGPDIKPILLAPADVLSSRPDIKAATATLKEKSLLAEAAETAVFPHLNLGGFYGLSDNALMDAGAVSQITLKAAVSLLDFGRLKGLIHMSRSEARQAFETYRNTVLTCIQDVEIALSNYLQFHKNYLSLSKALDNAQKSYMLSKQLYEAGESSLPDLLESEKAYLSAQFALLYIQSDRAKSIVALYEALGAY